MRRRPTYKDVDRDLLLQVMASMVDRSPSQQVLAYLIPDLKETGKEFGKGAYGVVVEMEYPGGAKVAGKKIHDIFFHPRNNEKEVKLMKDRFEEECVRYIRS